MKSRAVALTIAAVTLTLLVRCSGQVAGIETTNGATVAARASSIEGAAPPGARISVFDSAYIPLTDSGFGYATSAGARGEFSFENCVPGVYRVIIDSRDMNAAVAFQRVVVGASRGDSVYQARLGPTGAITGNVTMDSLWSGERILLYCVASAYYVVCSQPGPFALESVAPGTYEVRACLLAPGGATISPVITRRQSGRTVDVRPGQAVAAGNVSIR
ncbi:MAG: hypothetical protein GF398_08300 [Chitinivibrionales bacterium]|nr:hypothetical protein [Chitinivibrionales bacterium]